MKKILSLVLALAMLLSAGAVVRLRDDPITLVYSEVNPETSFVGNARRGFQGKG